MPSRMKTGLSGGAAANAMNVVQWHTGQRLVRATVEKASDTVAARSVLTRTTDMTVAKADSFTLVTS